MNSDLEDLIERMTTREQVKSSNESASWHAYREAEMLDSFAVVDELDAYLAKRRSGRERAAAYFIIDKVGKNLGDPRCASRLIGYVSGETDKYALSWLLEKLADIPMPAGENLEPVYALLRDKRWLVRQSAIRALIGSRDSEAEDKLLEVLAETSDPSDITYCHATLNRIGTRKSLPVLEQALTSRKRDVKLSAQLAIEAILAREAQPCPESAAVGENVASED